MICEVVDGVKTYPDGREVCLLSSAGLREYRRRTHLMADRQGGRCGSCQRRFNEWLRPTFGHARARGMGAANRDDRPDLPDGSWRNAAQCMDCQGVQGSREYEWRDGVFGPKEKTRLVTGPLSL